MRKKEQQDTTNGWNDPKVQQVLKDQIQEAGQRSIQEHEEYAKNLIEQGRQIGMIQGICIVTADILRGYDVYESWKGAGLTIEECRAADVCDADMEVIERDKRWLEEYRDKP